jgi:hypothetical protein
MWFCAMGEKTLGEGTLCVYPIGSMQRGPQWETKGVCSAEERRKDNGEEQRALHGMKSSSAPKMGNSDTFDRFDRLWARVLAEKPKGPKEPVLFDSTNASRC